MAGEQSNAKGQGSDQHILLIDDDFVSRALARALLTKNGFRVTEAADGAAGLAQLESNGDVAMIVVDLEMPVLGGREVLARARREPRTASLPIIVLTGVDSAALEAQLLEEGANAYIRKPLDPLRFVAQVRAILQGSTA